MGGHSEREFSRECRIEGRPRIVHQAYLGTADKVAALVKDRTSPVPLSAVDPLASGDDDPLDRAQLRLLDLWKGKQMVSRRRLAYDTTNFYTYIASNNRGNELAQRGHNKQGRHNLRQGASAMCWMEKTMWPMARNFLPRWQACWACWIAARSPTTRYVVFDKGSAALANTVELQEAKVGWISALPWNQAPAAFRQPKAEALPLCSSAQPGVRAAAEKLLVHGQEYLYVLKYSASFAGEQLTV